MAQCQTTQVSRDSAALDLAEAFMDDMSVHHPEEQERNRTAVILAGCFIAEEAEPGEWEAFEAGAFFSRIDHLDPRQLLGTGLALMGFFGWMFFHEMLRPHDCLRMISGIRAVFPQSVILGGLYDNTARMLKSYIDDVQ